MDPENVSRMKAHYDAHARPGQQDPRGSHATGRSRQYEQQDATMELRRFHNSVKRELIARFASRRLFDVLRDETGTNVSTLYDKPRLLDIACGRGGDLWKWSSAGIGEVLAVDLSPMEIEEAKKRFEQLKKRHPRSDMEVTFRQTDLIGVSEVPFIKKSYYTATSCMFAAHYFLASESSFHCFMKTVSDSLVDGGYFFGTMPEGKAIMRLLNKKMSWVSPYFAVHAKWGEPDEKGHHPEPKPFGSGFIYSIKNTVTDGGEGSYEYLVFFKVFKVRNALVLKFSSHELVIVYCKVLRFKIDARRVH